MWKDTEDLAKKGFIDKDYILSKVSEEDIFELVFRFRPKEYDYVSSPFRPDKNPGCYFEYSPSGELRFKDFANSSVIRGTKMLNIDCFDAVKIHFNLPGFYQTLDFIKSKLIDGKTFSKSVNTKVKGVESKPRTTILTDSRNFLIEDKKYWFDRYEITKENLKEDGTFPISSMAIQNPKKNKDFLEIKVKEITYCFTGFEEGRKKIYRPLRKGQARFITNCNENDIGGLKFLPREGKQLIITKSYKDYRVVKNQGYNVVWFQNEGMFPSLEILLPLCSRFEEVIILYDNDKAGIEAAKTLVSIINSYLPNKSKYIHIPVQLLAENIKDPSDMIETKGRISLLEFLFQRT